MRNNGKQEKGREKKSEEMECQEIGREIEGNREGN